MAAYNTPTTGMRSEIQKKWSQFTYQEVAALSPSGEDRLAVMLGFAESLR